MANLTPVMQQNFIEYASYTIVERAFPDLRDGCKPVQRRILQTLFEVELPKAQHGVPVEVDEDQPDDDEPDRGEHVAVGAELGQLADVHGLRRTGPAGLAGRDVRRLRR